MREARETGSVAAKADPDSGGTVLGADRRERVNKTTKFPATATTFITFQQGSETLTCTGWLISNDTVATAGHCVNTGPDGGGGWSTNVTVYPGRNGKKAPYGSCGAKSLWSVNGWIDDGDENFDYGAIKLDCTIGDTTGWYGFFWTTGTLKGFTSNTRGYPDDKKDATQWVSKNCAGETGFKQCTIKISQAQEAFYSNDTFTGQDGSPVYYNRTETCNPCAMAIHAYGLHGSNPHNLYNHGPRITEDAFNFLVDIINK